MNKLKNLFALFFVLFLTLNSFSCAMYNKYAHGTNFQDDHSLSGLKIINYGSSVLPTPFDTVKYYIDGKKAASHHSDSDFETIVQLPPGEHDLIVDYGKPYECKYSFTIDQGQIGTFNNYSYYTYVMSKVDKTDLESWGFKNVNSRVMEKKVTKVDCNAIGNDTGKKICKEYYDNLCR